MRPLPTKEFLQFDLEHTRVQYPMFMLQKVSSILASGVIPCRDGSRDAIRPAKLKSVLIVATRRWVRGPQNC